MRFLILSLRRKFRTPLTAAVLIFCTAVMVLSGFVTNDYSSGSALFYNADNTDASEKLSGYLEGFDFFECESETELRKLVGKGDYDVGVIIPDGFGNSICNKKPKVYLIVSEAADVYEIKKNQVAASVYAVYAPYISSDETELINKEEIIKRYDELMSKGKSFSFDIEVAAGQSKNTAMPTLFIPAAAFILFLLLFIPRVLKDEYGKMKTRIGVDTVCSVLLPDIVIDALISYACVVVSAAILFFIKKVPFNAADLLALFDYALLLISLSLMAEMLLSSASKFRISELLMLLVSFIVFPIYADLSPLIPILKYVRIFTPPCWILYCLQKPFLFLIAGLCAVFISLLFQEIFLRNHKTS